jgi:hypothetical protein
MHVRRQFPQIFGTFQQKSPNLLQLEGHESICITHTVRSKVNFEMSRKTIIFDYSIRTLKLSKKSLRQVLYESENQITPARIDSF